MKIFKRVLATLAALLAMCVLVVGGYIGYMEFTYNRIPDMQPTEVIADKNVLLQPGVAYTAVTYNIGFGAYTPDYTFFMDEGTMADGTKTVGKVRAQPVRKAFSALPWATLPSSNASIPTLCCCKRWTPTPTGATTSTSSRL